MSRHESEMHRQRRHLRNLGWDVVEAFHNDATQGTPELQAATGHLRSELWRQAPASAQDWIQRDRL